MSKIIKLGRLSIDAIEYGIQGNAILGIKESGKTYTATLMAERLYAAGIPFCALDPSGVWRFLRYPGSGKGLPVVIAGGESADQPLTVSGAPEIMRAAIGSGVSVVFDLTDPNLSKADWRRIVKDCCRILLRENGKHGLRHVFLEEAVEFVPQQVREAGDVYAEVEKMVRIGGNARVGITLIGQRAQEINKAVLELCTNLFLHRQQGKNAILSLEKWLDVASVKNREEIVESLPTLASGKCWAWIGGDNPQPPILVGIPEKNSMHPNRRSMRGDVSSATKPVDVGRFVSDMKTNLVKVEEERKANDVVLLRATIGELKAEVVKLKKQKAAPDADALKMAREQGRAAGHSEGWSDSHEAIRKMANDFYDEANKTIHSLSVTIREFRNNVYGMRKVTKPEPSPTQAPEPLSAKNFGAVPDQYVPAIRFEKFGSGPQAILDSILWCNELGIAEPDGDQVSTVAGFIFGSGTWSTYLSRLRSSGLIEEGKGYTLTSEGRLTAKAPSVVPSWNQMRSFAFGRLDASLQRIFQPIMEAYPAVLSGSEVAEASGFSHGSGTFSTYMSRLRGKYHVVEKKSFKAQSWMFSPSGD